MARQLVFPLCVAFAAVRAMAACAEYAEKIGGSWEIRLRKSGTMEWGNTIESLHRHTPLGTIKVDDHIDLVHYYGDDCVVWTRRGLFAACGDRNPVFIASGGQKVTSEGVVNEGDFLVRDGIPWRRLEIIPVGTIKTRAITAGLYNRLWRATVDDTQPIRAIQTERRWDLSQTDENGRTPLVWLVIQDDTEAVRALIRAGADVNARDRHGYSALMLAAEQGQDRILRLLIDAGADLNVQPNPGDTPLLRAVMGGHVETALTLIKAGANVNTKELVGAGTARETTYTPLSMAEHLKLDRIVEALQRAGAKE